MIAACALLFVSCGVSSNNLNFNTGNFLFIEFDKDTTGSFFLVIIAILAIYWILRIRYTTRLHCSYDQLIDITIHKSENSNTNDESDEWKTVGGTVAVGHFVARITPIAMFWSWFIDIGAREYLYWFVVILTSLAVRYIPEWLGFNMWGFRKAWIVIWSIICLVGYIALL